MMLMKPSVLILVGMLVVGDINWAASHVYFSPADDIRSIVLSYIKTEEQAIKAAIYWITDREYLQELIEASGRGVLVEMIVDKSTLEAKPATLKRHIEKLVDAGIKIYVFDAIYGNMHNKFCIFESNTGHGNLQGNPRSVMYTGSFNWTWKANYANRENVTFTDSGTKIGEYKKQFEKIKDEISTQGIWTKKAISSKRVPKAYLDDIGIEFESTDDTGDDFAVIDDEHDAHAYDDDDDKKKELFHDSPF